MPVPSDTLYPSETLFPGDGNQTIYAPQTIVGAQLINLLAWLQGDETLQWYLDAIGALFQQTAQIVLDQGTDGDADYQTGYGSIFTVNPRFTGDTAICPTDQLPYLSQYVGVTLPPNASDAASRSLITAEAGFHRGTPSAIVAAAQRFLNPGQTVTNVERTRPDGTRSGYWFLLVVEPSEVIDTAALIDAVNAVKPGGLMWQLVSTAGTAWDADSRVWSSDATTWNAN